MERFLRLATEKHWPLNIADPVGTFELAREACDEMLNRERFTRSAVAMEMPPLKPEFI